MSTSRRYRDDQESSVVAREGMFNGYVVVNCRFDDDWHHGRSEFRNCR